LSLDTRIYFCHRCRKSVWVIWGKNYGLDNTDKLLLEEGQNGIEFLAGKIVSRIKDVCNQSYRLGCIKLEIDNMESS
jgi:hypothetical protein